MDDAVAADLETLSIANTTVPNQPLMDNDDDENTTFDSRRDEPFPNHWIAMTNRRINIEPSSSEVCLYELIGCVGVWVCVGLYVFVFICVCVCVAVVRARWRNRVLARDNRLCILIFPQINTRQFLFFLLPFR